MKEKLEELLASAQERLKSPFLLTYCVVWLVHHWRLIFIILNFDTSENRGAKKQLIEEYITSNDGWFGMAFIPVLWAIGSIVVYYTLTILIEIIGYGYLIVKVWARDKTNNRRTLVTVEEHNFFVSRNKKLESKNKELSKSLADSTRSYEELEVDTGTRINQLIQTNETLQKMKSDFEESNNKLNNEIKKLTEESIDKDAESTKTKLELQDLKFQLLGLDKKNKQESLVEFDKLFGKGKWQLYYNGKGSEIFHFRLDNSTFITTQNKFVRISDIVFDKELKIISFKKSNNEFDKLLTSIVKISDEYYIGVEGNGAKVEYRKI